jgi:hypothetical protein
MSRYFNAVRELNARFPQDHALLRNAFSAVLEFGSRATIFHPQAFRLLGSASGPMFRGRSTPVSELRKIVSDFIELAQRCLGASFPVFLRYISLYISGKISHAIFLRLFLKLLHSAKSPVSPAHPCLQVLPQAMAALQCSSFLPFKAVNLPKSITDHLAIETIIGITGNVSAHEVGRTVAKCLSCLSIGLISQDVAKQWLQVHCNENVIERMGEISDFSYYHPGRFPHELILCPCFLEKVTPTSVCQQFLNQELSNDHFSSYRPVFRELLGFKLRGLRKTIRKLETGGEFAAEELAFLYGGESQGIVDGLPSCASVVIDRLAVQYGEVHNLLQAIYSHQMSQLSPGEPEFRFPFKKTLRPEFVKFPYHLPGSRVIHFASRQCIDIALALIADFIRVYFGESEGAIIFKGFNTFAPLFEQSQPDLILATDALLQALLYFSTLTRMIVESGDSSTVIIGEDHSLQDSGHESDYGRRLAQLPKVLKTSEVPLREIFEDTILQHADLVISHCSRALYAMGNSESLLARFPDISPDDFMLTTIQQNEETEQSVSFTIVSVFSPFFIDYELPASSHSD